MEQLHPALLALLGTGFTFLCTTLGAAVVYFFKGAIKPIYNQIFLGFAAGVMIAASVWSLLIPAIDMAQEQHMIGWLVAAGGFVIGGLFLMTLDHILPHLHPGSKDPEGPKSKLKRTTMLVFAVTLHNIPEGMAVGLSFALAATSGSGIGLAAAIALAIGIGLQNFPEGAAISLPLKQEGCSNNKAFIYGSLSGIVEPIFGVLTVFLVGAITPLLPWLLSFAAGAMIFVTVEELIPEAQLGEHSHAGTAGVMLGFMIMMILDVALG
ncbi:MAG: ZIP family metal transporter [Erysipelotrichaceae bacterium]